MLRLRARDGAFRAPARVTFFFCKKKVTKENHSNLRFKDPLARGGQVQIWRYALAHEVQWVTLSVQGALVPLAPLPLTAVRVGAGTLVVFGDYQIAPIAALCTAMGRWRLTPPGYGGICLPAGRSADLTRHRRVIQYREPPKGKANGGTPFNTANPSRGRLGLVRPGHPSPCDLIRGKADACGWEGGRR